jgi:hypothetical protein
MLKALGSVSKGAKTRRLFHDFMARCESYFAGNGCIVKQPF